MDIGLGKFLEMFEQRFGRAATTALLAIIGLGLAGFMCSLIWGHIIMPLYSFAGFIVGNGQPAANIGQAFNWITIGQVALTVFQFFVIVFCSIILLTISAMAIQHVVFDYWKTVFRRNKSIAILAKYPPV
jgi:hypothetical protein